MATEDSNNYLYLAKNLSGQIGYVGIGGVTRPYGEHTPPANHVLRNGEVWMTESPFSTRQDAEMAESLLIRALTWASETKPNLSNIAKVEHSKHLIPALRYRDGVLKYSEVNNALFVKIRPGNLEGRSAPHGESGDIDLTIRCNRWWRLGSAVKQKRDIKYLIAITAHVKPSRVIGVWHTRPPSEWWYENQKEPTPVLNGQDEWNAPVAPLSNVLAKGWVVTVDSPNPDVNEWQGLEFDWEGYNPQNIGYSTDLGI